ncbi:PREDICTED: uncharacterized protein LOC108568622 [Nicrophorus vespilloides]|uniref:Uncharacterized protein LOC108568622 n=1 Tax=Nicrophorus vespilloides TaxID=110193 RepID=A0ABM1NEQ9_NICVS|nr:PREDICTED: uncharacterized protein LOC108568622 [Nicrophorus vespilloides]
MSPLPQNVLSEDEVKSVLTDVVQKECISEPVYAIDAGSNKGEGYVSFITRVDVHSKEKDLHLIVKCAPKSDEFRSMFPVRKTFEREIYFYENIYPTLKEFQKEKRIKDYFDSFPKFYKSSLKEKEELIVLENIRLHGFQLLDRKMQFDDAHLQMIFQEYAKYHAISFALQYCDPEKYYDLSKDLHDMFTPGIFSFDFFGMFGSCLDHIDKLYEDEEIKRDINHLKDNVLKYFEHIVNNKGKRVVITHGDCWSNNMMFKYSDPNNPGQPTDLCLLDFQLIRKGSPVLDLSYFFYAGGPKHLLDKLDDYLKLYYSVLKNQLENFGVDVMEIITFEDLKSDWKIYSKFGYLLALLIQKNALTEGDEILDLSKLSANKTMTLTEAFHQEFKNQKFINERLKNLTDHMHENDFLRIQY